ncbi:MAG: hypothetical protein ACYCX4_18220, partial [Bacillota bacterium]
VGRPLSVWQAGKDDEDEDQTALGWRFRKTLIDIAKGPDSPARLHFVKNQNKNDIPLHLQPLDDNEVVCGNCQLICWENKEERLENLKLLRSSGIVTLDKEGNEVIIRNGEVVDKRPYFRSEA